MRDVVHITVVLNIAVLRHTFVRATTAGSSGGFGLLDTESPPHSEAADHADADGEAGEEATSPERATGASARAPFRPPWRDGAAAASGRNAGAAEAPLDVSKDPGAEPGRKVSRFFQRTAPAAGMKMSHTQHADVVMFPSMISIRGAICRSPLYPAKISSCR